MPTAGKGTADAADVNIDVRHTEALLETGALQSAIFNSANFSSIATDAKGVIQIFNVGAERMLGYTAAEVMNKITPADISDPQELIARAKALSVELGTPITPGFEALVFKASRGIEDIYELTYIRKDRSRFPAVVSVTALRDAKDAIIGYLLIGTDNTARKQAEEALLKAGALQSAIFNSANFSSIATDAKGVIQIFNVGAERMLGYASADVMNKITPADISDPQELITRAIALSLEFATPIAPGFEALVFKATRGIEDIYELTYIRKDGSRFPAVLSVTALRDAQDAIIGYLLIGTDNTARKELQARVLERTVALETTNAALGAEVTERRRAEHALHEVDRRKNEFLATLAHELRNPLAPIRHATEILSRGGPAPDGRARDAGALAVIERQVTHLVRLIDDLLDVSRIMHGKLELRRQPILLTEMVESALEASRPLFLARHHALDVALPEEPLPVFGDPVRLTQILTNLLSNAARYTEPGGRVRVNAARDGDAVVIRVIDSGIGIPAAELAHIFTMFGQATRERESSEAGLGIGLAVAKRLTEMHGGTLTAASEGERAGSIFTLHLPLGPQFPAIVVAEGASRSRSQPGVPRRVLVVDDNVDAALTLAELLSLDGHETFVAHDGPSAVTEAERTHPEVAVLDIGLPGFDGLEVARRLRAKPALTGILLVALSGWVQPADRERSSAAGFDYHLAKPVDLTTLRRLLTEVGARPAAA